jgi:O-acetyl-ADP-ribose deacetylase (regulator of RNase III)
MSEPGPVSRRFGSTTVTVTAGDLTLVQADAVVNAANNHLWMGGGVAGAIKRRGGEEIEREAMKQGPVQPGAAVVTTAGRLKARHCIHAAVMDQDLVPTADYIEQATRASLEHAARLGLESIAFPALGTGVGGFPLHESARAMFRAAAEHARATSLPTQITLVLADQPAYSAFALELERARP